VSSMYDGISILHLFDIPLNFESPEHRQAIHV
jgi:hypothetical protein